VRSCNCPFSVNFGKAGDGDEVRILSTNLEHDHPPDHHAVSVNEGLTTEMKVTVARYGYSAVPPGQALRLLRRQFPDVPWSKQRVKNLYRQNGHDARTDAHDLVEELLEAQRQDPRWSVVPDWDKETGELKKLFWMTPEQCELAKKYPWVWIHDNTYKCNRYALALGLWSTVSIGGHTVELAACLVNKEDTDAYEWQFKCMQKAVGYSPHCLFTDADPAVHAAVRQCFGPETDHFWCLWHIGKNLVEKLRPKDVSSFDAFRRDFYRAQRQPDKEIFKRMWTTILERYPKYYDYLAKNSGLHHVERWALAWQVGTFTAGMTGTSRGEGLNRQQKRYLSKRSTLMKVAIQVKARREEEKLIQEADVRAMNSNTTYATRMQGTNGIVPRVMKEAGNTMGVYGFNLMVQQILKSSPYVCSPQNNLPQSLPQPTFDQIVHLHAPAFAVSVEAAADLAQKSTDEEDEVTRHETVANFVKTVGEHTIWEVSRTGTATAEGVVSAPQYVVNYAKQGGCFTKFFCTCSYSVRFGVPCRHYWSVYTRGSGLGYHSGLVHPSWLKVKDTTVSVIPGNGHVGAAPPPVEVVWPEVKEITNEWVGFQQVDIETDTSSRGEARRYGQLLGQCKVLIDMAVKKNKYKDTMTALKSLMAKVELDEPVNPGPQHCNPPLSQKKAKKPKASPAPPPNPTALALQVPQSQFQLPQGGLNESYPLQQGGWMQQMQQQQQQQQQAPFAAIPPVFFQAQQAQQQQQQQQQQQAVFAQPVPMAFQGVQQTQQQQQQQQQLLACLQQVGPHILARHPNPNPNPE
jgi:hypothetical protein